ncbi:formylglycine-generating enzyme family protein [Lacipirellula parvula]|nr:SUMF1/EgtB/PvdO family nonheme iron enzyme [Lacipirellula parvula]
MSTVPVGNPGNAGQLSGASVIGSPADGASTPYAGFGPDGVVGGVNYNYRIGTYEVTNAQYVEFLNAKATTDSLGLYNAAMGSNARGGIVQSGVSGSFAYTLKDNMGNKPVNFVGFFDSLRFINWLGNGQGAGNTETGSYTLLGGTAAPSNATTVARNAGAKWVLPTESEAYKAAYYDPRTAAQGGPAGDDHYWLYATKSDIEPTSATANAVGDISNPGANVANWGNGADWNALDGNVTTVGSAGPLSASYYGTYDQAGSVYEWNESLITGTNRGIRSGSFQEVSHRMRAYLRGAQPTTTEIQNLGFRVAFVPEPHAGLLAMLGASLVGLVQRRFSKRNG